MKTEWCRIELFCVHSWLWAHYGRLIHPTVWLTANWTRLERLALSSPGQASPLSLLRGILRVVHFSEGFWLLKVWQCKHLFPFCILQSVRFSGFIERVSGFFAREKWFLSLCEKRGCIMRLQVALSPFASYSFFADGANDSGACPDRVSACRPRILRFALFSFLCLSCAYVWMQRVHFHHDLMRLGRLRILQFILFPSRVLQNVWKRRVHFGKDCLCACRQALFRKNYMLRCDIQQYISVCTFACMQAADVRRNLVVSCMLRRVVRMHGSRVHLSSVNVCARAGCECAESVGEWIVRCEEVFGCIHQVWSGISGENLCTRVFCWQQWWWGTRFRSCAYRIYLETLHRLKCKEAVCMLNFASHVSFKYMVLSKRILVDFSGEQMFVMLVQTIVVVHACCRNMDRFIAKSEWFPAELAGLRINFWM